MRARPPLPRRQLRAARVATGAVVATLSSLLPPPLYAQESPRPSAPPPPAPDEARVVSVRGVAELVGPEARPLRVGDTLRRGHRVRTGAGAKVTLGLANGASLDLDENALLTLFASPSAPPDALAPTTLSRGTLRVRMATSGPSADPVPVQTEAVTVWAGRADAMVAADVGGHVTRMAVWRGRMRVRVGSREYLLPQGYGVTEEVGHGPGTLRLLPRAPVWRDAPPERVLSFGEPIDVSAMWAASPRAQGLPAAEWKVQVARDAAFVDVVESATVPASTTRWTAPRLTPGTYHMRVVAVDLQRFESASSPVVRVEVAAPTVVPASGDDSRRAAVHVPRGFYCGLDGAALTAWDAPRALEPGRAHRLRCAVHPSGRDAREHVIPAGLTGPLSREVRVDPPATDAQDGSATGTLSLRLRDAAGEPVSLAQIEVTASEGVSVDPVRETEQRGVYTTTVRWPSGVRACRVHFRINDALHFDHDARVERVQVVAPRAVAQAPTPAAPPAVEVIRRAPLPDPDDVEPTVTEE